MEKTIKVMVNNIFYEVPEEKIKSFENIQQVIFEEVISKEQLLEEGLL